MTSVGQRAGAENYSGQQNNPDMEELDKKCFWSRFVSSLTVVVIRKKRKITRTGTRNYLEADNNS